MATPSLTDRNTLWISLALCGLAFTFSFTPGLLAEVNQTGEKVYSNDYFSTGSDDDICVIAGAAIFGLFSILFGFWRTQGVKTLLKAIPFSLAWIFQLFLLHWIEVGSLWLTVADDLNVVLFLFLALYYISPLLLVIAVTFDLVSQRSKERAIQVDS